MEELCIHQKTTQVSVAFKLCQGLWGKERCWEGLRQELVYSGRLGFGERERMDFTVKEETLSVTSVGEGHVKGRLGC